MSPIHIIIHTGEPVSLFFRLRLKGIVEPCDSWLVSYCAT